MLCEYTVVPWFMNLILSESNFPLQQVSTEPNH